MLYTLLEENLEAILDCLAMALDADQGVKSHPTLHAETQRQRLDRLLTAASVGDETAYTASSAVSLASRLC